LLYFKTDTDKSNILLLPLPPVICVLHFFSCQMISEMFYRAEIHIVACPQACHHQNKQRCQDKLGLTHTHFHMDSIQVLVFLSRTSYD